MATSAPPAGSTTPALPQSLPPPLETAVQQAVTATFETICGAAPVLAGRPSTTQRRAAVIGVISFVGDHLWSIMLGVPRPTATPLALAFAGLEADFDSAEMGDIVGELANMLAGYVSALLDEQGIRAEISLPTVVRGRDIAILQPGQAPSVDLAFKSASGPFWVSLAMAGPGWSMGRRPGH
jgi:CheY-specific phosphatase CheX